MDIDRFCDRYPEIYHFTHGKSWVDILERGLLSPYSMLEFNTDLSKLQIAALMEEPRRESFTIVPRGFAHPVTFRDNHPLFRRGSKPGLADIIRGDTTFRDYMSLLNRRVFFWLDYGRLYSMAASKKYRNEDKTLLVLNTRQIIHNAGMSNVFLSTQNSGEAIWNAPRLGYDTFTPFDKFPTDSLADVVELSITNQVSTLCALRKICRIDEYHLASPILEIKGAEEKVWEC